MQGIACEDKFCFISVSMCFSSSLDGYFLELTLGFEALSRFQVSL